MKFACAGGAAVAAAAMVAVCAPTASFALSFQTPILSSPTLSSSGSTVQFKGLTPTNTGNPLPPGKTYKINSIQVAVQGTTGGSYQLNNYVSPTATATSPGQFWLSFNSLQASQSNAFTPSPGTVPGAPAFNVPGTLTLNITPTAKTYNWSIFPGGSPGSFTSFFTASTVTLPATCSFLPNTTGGALANPVDNCSFAINPNLSLSTITYNYDLVDVPAPLPLLGAGAAFGWSRRLRKRVLSRA